MNQYTVKMHVPAFVKNDVDLMRFLNRVEKRNQRYPNWRQIFYDCNGICQYPIDDDGSLCGAIDGLEFHEMYYDDGKIFQIALLCNYHHNSVHDGVVNPRPSKSKLQLDVEIEMRLSGHLDDWKAKYNIVDRKVKYDFSMDYRSYADCLINDENS